MNYFIEEKTDRPTPTPELLITPPRQYTLEELEAEILQNSSLGVNALKIATEAIKGILSNY